MGQNSGFLPKLCISLVAFLLLGAVAAQAQVRPRVLQAVDENRRVTLTGNVHPLARAEFDRGTVSGSQPMTRILLLLKRSDEQEAALIELMAQQQDKSSPNYHVWLTPEEYGAQFGLADADIQAVTDWLVTQGFSIDKVYAGRTVIEFSGNVAQVRNSLGTEIRRYAVNGKEYTANVGNPQIPVALAPVIAGIVSLNNFPRQSYSRYAGIARKPMGPGGLQPDFTFPQPDGSGNFYGLGPGDFATIYNSKSLIAGGNDGTGQTIAVLGETNINPKDVLDFRAIFGLPANFTASNIILNGEDPGVTSIEEESEANLDVQWSGAAAPKATVKYVVSASTPVSAGIDLSALYIIEHNLAGVMSLSYGACEQDLGSAGNSFYNSMWQQAAAQGITVVVSSGDGGSAGCDNFNSQDVATRGLAVSGLSGTPYNVSVGGTDFDQRNNPLLYWNATNDSVTGTSAKGYIPEIPWNENCAQISFTGCGASAPDGSVNIVAASGGHSTIYSKPAWQMGVTGMLNDSKRDQPDVSLFASSGFDGTGYIVCQQDRNASGQPSCDLSTGNGYLDFHVFGGTSASAPAFAGVMALVNQYQAAHGGTNRQGNANQILYALAKKSGASCISAATEAAGCVFNDVTKGNSSLPTGGAGLGTISVPCKGGTPNCSATLASNTGVLVDPAHAATEAWTTTAGYDMATGLGSVNINNLATNWKNVSTVATTTTLTLSPQSGITHGANENVTVGVVVKPASGVATGDVSLIAKFADGSTQGLDQFTLASGTITGAKTQSLPGGTYSVIAHYAGDGTNAPSDSAAVAVTVGKENSQTFIEVPTFDATGQFTNINASTFPYGTQFFIRMYVANTAATLGADGLPSPFCADVNPVTCPTGSIVLTDNGSVVDQGTFNLNGAGYTRDLAPSFITFAGGTHNLKAVYRGDNSFNTSTGNDAITVTPAVTTSQLTNYPNTAVAGQPIFLQATATASVAPGVAAAGGAFTFYDGTTVLSGTVFLSNNAGYVFENFTTSLSTPGAHTITAKYSGDTNYATSTSTPATISVLKPVSITQSESSINVTYGQSITLTAIVKSTSTSPPITGQIQFHGNYESFTQGPSTPGIDSSGNQILTATATTIPTSTGPIAVSYNGDANYGGAQSSDDLITVNIPDFSMPANVTINAIAGQTGTATVQITPASNTPSPVAIDLIAGSIRGTNLSVSATSVNLNGAPATVTLQWTTTGTDGVQSNAKAQIKRAGLLAISRVRWWNLSAHFLILALFLMSLPRRQKYYRAVFFSLIFGLLSIALGCGGGGGGGTIGGGGGGGGGNGEGPAVTTTALNADTLKIGPGMTSNMTATVTSSKALSGTVTLYRDSFPISTPTALVAGKASWPVAYFELGTSPYTAVYSGDPQNLTSSSATLNLVNTGSTQVYLSGQTGTTRHTTTITLNLQ